MMTRLNLLLLLAVVVSALYLVQTQYDSRRLFVELEKETARAKKLQSQQEQLQVAIRAQSTPLRVEKIAKDQLQMRPAGPAITRYVTRAPAAASAAPASAAAAPAVPATALAPATAPSSTLATTPATAPTAGGAQ